MRVLFVHSEEDYYSPEKPLESLERMQFGISYISALLKREGHETRLVVLTRKTEAVLEEHVADFDPGLICFTFVYTEFAFMSEMAARVKKNNPDIFMLAGGPHASVKPDECLESAFDAVCAGEGEYPTLELVTQLEEGRAPTGIANLHIKHGEEIERNASRPFLADLDSLPFPDREMWLPWTAYPLSRPSILLGRGCPFQCAYCCNHALARIAPGRYVRLRSPESVVKEILEIKAINPHLPEVYLEVETLGCDREWACELCSQLERMNSDLETPLVFGANLRVTPNTNYDDLFAGLARARFRFINIGLESGSERLRREVLKRNYSNQDVIEAVRSARRHGLHVGIYNLIGIPGETRRDFRETARVTRECAPDWYLLSIFFPYPGTDLYDRCKELGLLDSPLCHSFERRRPTMNLPGFSKRQQKRRFIWSHFLFCHGNRPAREIVRQVGRAKIYSTPWLLRCCRALSKT
ncbi:MAG: hypothetical protein CVT63_06055 [Candidatus Anoxymicrobium japonicum]|uniref:Uncharacterized protein n=1 Tax=Candidatus Anoxymicrobium japonicum TaxID=2013648 RepID=A0A2N3G513_9ACTN|nr:MAG: hypothetical protein CVT63_06055 [Candidatus Anoxymicrobium japonicum]